MCVLCVYLYILTPPSTRHPCSHRAHTDTRYARSPHYIPSVGGIKFPFSAMFSAIIRTVQTWLGFGYRYKGDLLGETQWAWLEDVLKSQNVSQHMHMHHSIEKEAIRAAYEEKEEGFSTLMSENKGRGRDKHGNEKVGKSIPLKFDAGDNSPDYTVIVSSIQGVSTDRAYMFMLCVFMFLCVYICFMFYLL